MVMKARGKDRCQHPKLGIPILDGQCTARAQGEYEVPLEYDPKNRLKTSYIMPRPRVKMCRYHKAIFDAWTREGNNSLNGSSHEVQCSVCRHPHHREICLRWSQWFISSADAIQELGVSSTTFYRHVEHFGLMDKKSSRMNTKRALVIAAEKGFGAGGHNVRTALTALQLLAKERGDVEEVRHTVTGVIGTVDLTKLTEKQLAAMADKLARELEATAAERPALEADNTNVVDGEVIELPAVEREKVP